MISGGMDFHQVYEVVCGNWRLEMTSTSLPVHTYNHPYLYIEYALPPVVCCCPLSMELIPYWHSHLLFTTYPGCLQLLEILEIYWNLKTLLEILEISWNLIGPPGNFCVRCQWSTSVLRRRWKVR